MKNLCIIQARMGATRLPGKVLKKVNNITLLEYEINRIKRAEKINKIVVATSNKPADDAIEKECARLGINCFRGSENDVLDRYWQCALKYYDYDNIIRATGDCTLIDPVIIDKVINLFEKNNLDYASNVLKETFPDGMDVEIFKRTVLEDAVNNAKLPSEREHVTQCIIKNKKFKKGNLSSRYNFGHFRLTVDEPRDFEVIKFLIENCKPDASYLDYISILTKNPEVMLKNMNITRNEGLLKSLKNDFVVKNKFNESNEMLSKVNKVIPLASQTFSKSYLQYIKGQAPLFVTHAKGCRIWDVDGNEYIDFINGLLPVVLGYQYPAVDNAIKEQLEKGIIFSLPSTLEYELAQILIKHIPCAEMVRFGKNGSDATSGAVRLARAITGRDHVACCGYHGWHDWYIGSTARHLGIPESTRKMTHKFEYNNIESLKKIFNENIDKVACVIMEPMNYEEPKDNFLEKVKELTHKNNALLIFDEVITGFRYSMGGAQKLFEITPDLATFGKSMANGMPISALVGKQEYMKKAEDIFYSFTMGGEALSLAAAIATIKELEDKKVIEYIWQKGGYLIDKTNELIKKYNLEEVIKIKGKPCWSLMFTYQSGEYTDLEIKSYLQQEILQSGFLWYGQHNMGFSHSQEDIDKLLGVYDKVFAKLKELLDAKKLKENLKGEPITNVFKVR